MNRRLICLALAGTLLGSGCRTAEQTAADDVAGISVGMSKAEVLARLGEPTLRQAEGPREVWRYNYDMGTGVLYWTLVVLLYVVVIGLLLLARGGGGGNMGEAGVSVRIIFGEDGAVEWVSPVEPGP